MSRRLVRRSRAIVVALVASLVPLLAAPGGSAEAAAPTTSVTVIHLEGQTVDNRCNGDAVVLHGDLTIITTTLDTDDGGSLVQGTSITTDLTGSGLPSNMTYRAAWAELSFAHYLPPPGGGAFTDVQLWRLQPDGNAQTMYLATVVQEEVTSEGTTASLDKTYSFCGRSWRTGQD